MHEAILSCMCNIITNLSSESMKHHMLINSIVLCMGGSVLSPVALLISAQGCCVLAARAGTELF